MFWFSLAAIASKFIGGSSGNSAILTASNSIGIIEIKGVILDATKPLADLQKFQNSPGIKAIVIRIDSPGGAVGASQELYAEIKRVNQSKPVIASMGSVAASGGFYAAIGAEKIVANPGTMTGSMGVIMKFANLQEIYQKIGYQSEVIKSGEFKDIGSSARDISPEERKLLQGLIDIVHLQFINDIAESRALTVKEVTKIADGRIFSGAQAHEYGLIDELGNFNDAIRLAATSAGLEPEPLPELIYPKNKNFEILELLSGKVGLNLQGLLVNPAPYLSYQWAGAGYLTPNN